MLTISETNINVKFLNPETIHVHLNEGAMLTTQLIRELRVISKAKNGTAAKAYIITINDMSEAFGFFCNVCHKTQRIESDVTVAVVCNKACLQAGRGNRASVCMRPGAAQLFTNFNAALSWVKATG